MRKLTLEDAFTLSEILDKMEIQLDLNKMLDDARNKGKDAQAYFGGQAMLMVIKSAHKAKKELCEWMASLSGKTVEEVKSMSIKEMKVFFKELFSTEDIGDFFEQAVTG